MAAIPEVQKRHLADALKGAGWSLLPGDRSIAARITKDGARYPIIFRHAPEARRSILQALLAESILRGRSAQRTEFIAMVGAPSISPAMAHSLEDFIAEVAPGQPFGYVDDRGLVRFRGPGLEAIRGEPSKMPGPRAVSQRPPNLFSDLNQWLLKILAAHNLPPAMIAIPREPIGTYSDLAASGQVSVPVAWRLQRALKDGGYLDDAGNLASISDLFARWRSVYQRPQQRVGAKWIFPGRNSMDRLRSALSDTQMQMKELSACLGLFSACDELGWGHVKGAPVYVYVRHLESELVERLGLVIAEEGQEPDLFLQVARWPESVFRAAVSPQGVPAADVIQCWLDVSHEPTRGIEQAQLLWRRILGPALRADEPKQ